MRIYHWVTRNKFEKLIIARILASCIRSLRGVLAIFGLISHRSSKYYSRAGMKIDGRLITNQSGLTQHPLN